MLKAGASVVASTVIYQLLYINCYAFSGIYLGGKGQRSGINLHAPSRTCFCDPFIISSSTNPKFYRSHGAINLVATCLPLTSGGQMANFETPLLSLFFVYILPLIAKFRVHSLHVGAIGFAKARLIRCLSELFAAGLRRQSSGPGY